jgi:transmembrane sensor
MEKKQVIDLLDRYNAGDCTEAERALIESWYLQYQNNSLPDLSDAERSVELDTIFKSLPIHSHTRGWRFHHFMSIAASVAVLFIIGAYFYKSKEKQPTKQAKAVVKPITPGGNKAVLTLADGSKIVLDDAKDGVLASQGSVKVQKTADGQLVYTFPETSEGELDRKAAAAVYNTIETPAGGSYQVMLPDGTRVWLNAASSLRFPALFKGKVREVNLTGEAYFEVAKNKNMPFKVITNDNVVEVLGTHFNVNSYPDEGASKTTLVEGSVKVRYRNKSVLLSPGQQSRLGVDEIKVVDADVEQIIAWKEGFFLFRNEDLESIMRKISRWYDIEIMYAGRIPNTRLGGKISRSKDIHEVLKVLELTNAIRFKVEGRRVIIMR